MVIRKYIEDNKFTKVRMWDDHEPNLRALLKMKEDHPEIEFEAYIVYPNTGFTRRYSG